MAAQENLFEKNAKLPNIAARFNLPRGAYFLSHSVGCLPKSSETALMDRYLGRWKEAGGNAWPDWLDELDRFRSHLAGLLGGRKEDYCPQTNVTSGLVKYLSSHKPSEKRSCILMHKDSFPSIAFAIGALSELGWSLRFIESSTNESGCHVSDWTNALTDDVAVVVATHVFSNTGKRSPILEIVAACRELDVLTIVDVAQSAGVTPLNLHELNANMVMGSCVKWLCGGPGAGFLWVNPADLTSLMPKDVGWFSHENPFEFDIQSFRYAPCAMRFMGGTPSIAPFVIAANSISTFIEIGVDAVIKHNEKLKKVFRSALAIEQANLHEGGTLCVAFRSEGDANSASNALAENMMLVDQRNNVIRASFHIYNTEAEAKSFAAILSDFPIVRA